MKNGTNVDDAATDPLAGWRDPPGLGRMMAMSSAIGVGVSLVVITVGMMAAGQVWQSSLGLGIFVAFWGGLGFGSMVGGVIYLTRLDAAVEALKTETATGATATDDVGTRADWAAGVDTRPDAHAAPAA